MLWDPQDLGFSFTGCRTVPAERERLGFLAWMQESPCPFAASAGERLVWVKSSACLLFRQWKGGKPSIGNLLRESWHAWKDVACAKTAGGLPVRIEGQVRLQSSCAVVDCVNHCNRFFFNRPLPISYNSLELLWWRGNGINILKRQMMNCSIQDHHKRPKGKKIIWSKSQVSPAHKRNFICKCDADVAIVQSVKKDYHLNVSL